MQPSASWTGLETLSWLKPLRNTNFGVQSSSVLTRGVWRKGTFVGKWVLTSQALLKSRIWADLVVLRLFWGYFRSRAVNTSTKWAPLEGVAQAEGGGFVAGSQVTVFQALNMLCLEGDFCIFKVLVLHAELYWVRLSTPETSLACMNAEVQCRTSMRVSINCERTEPIEAITMEQFLTASWSAELTLDADRWQSACSKTWEWCWLLRSLYKMHSMQFLKDGPSGQWTHSCHVNIGLRTHRGSNEHSTSLLHPMCVRFIAWTLLHADVNIYAHTHAYTNTHIYTPSLQGSSGIWLVHLHQRDEMEWITNGRRNANTYIWTMVCKCCRPASCLFTSRHGYIRCCESTCDIPILLEQSLGHRHSFLEESGQLQGCWVCSERRSSDREWLVGICASYELAGKWLPSCRAQAEGRNYWLIWHDSSPHPQSLLHAARHLCTQ